MKYRRLGKTDLKVSAVGIGTWQYGGEWGKDFTDSEVKEIIDRGHELGFNLIDTAECYGDHLSESLIGRALEGSRDQWVLATKFGHSFDLHFKRHEIWDAGGVRKQLENSLRALRTDYVDLYQFHSGTDEEFNNDELWTMLDKQVKAGKIRHLGISVSSGRDVCQAGLASKVGAEVIQVRYNRLEREPETGVLPVCIQNDLGVLARVPLASGFLSGKYKPGTVFPSSDVRSSRDQNIMNKWLKQVEEIQRTEVPEGMEMAQWAIGWVLQNPAVSACIPGYKNIRQLESAAKAVELDMVSDAHPRAWK